MSDQSETTPDMADSGYEPPFTMASTGVISPLPRFTMNPTGVIYPARPSSMTSTGLISPAPPLSMTSTGLLSPAPLSSMTPTGVISPATNPSASQPPVEVPVHVSYTADAAPFMQVASSAVPLQSIPEGATMISHTMSPNERRRKRGRPRRYDPNTMPFSMAMEQQPINVSMPQHEQPGIISPPPMLTPSMDGSAGPSTKKKGRPRGSRNDPQLMKALRLLAGAASTAFTPYAVNVNAGEDVYAKIMAISRSGPRSVCVLSGNGLISTVTLRQPATSGGTATYEGRYDILSLSGCFTLSEASGHKSRIGGLSISLATTDGRVIGGSVAGLLVAASPVQVVVGSFPPSGNNEPKANVGGPSVPPTTDTGGPIGGNKSPSQTESSDGQPSPVDLSVSQGMPDMPWE